MNVTNMTLGWMTRPSSRIYFEEDDGGGFGGGASAFPPIDAGDGDPGTGDDGEAPTGDPGAGGAPNTPPAFDPNAFAQQFGASFAQTFQQQAPPQQQQQMSPEEAARLMNVWNPDAAFLEQFGNVETQAAAFQVMRDALVRQADTATQVRLHQLEQQINARFAPMLEMMQQQEATAREGRFTGGYPQLASPELKPLLNSLVQQLVGEKRQFGSEKEMFAEIAKRAEAVIKSVNPSFKLNPVTAGPPTAIPVTTPGGGGGGGMSPGGGNSNGNAPKAVSFFPKVRA